jgi:hypothetical protein
MYNTLKYIVLIAIASMLLGVPPAMAQDKARGLQDRPSGWDEGEKTGWQDDMPPGLLTPPGWVKGVKKGWQGGVMPPGLEKQTVQHGVTSAAKGKGEKKPKKVKGDN